MKPVIAALSAVLSITAFPVTALAQDDPAGAPAARLLDRVYVEGSVGYSESESVNYGCCGFEIESGTNVGAALGYEVRGNWAVELELFYQHLEYGGCTSGCAITDYNSAIQGMSVMANLVYTVPAGWVIDPYVGVGLGMTEVRYDGGTQFSLSSGEAWTEGYQVMLGARHPLTDRVSLFAEYRYTDIFDDVTIENVDFIDINSNSLSLGARVHF